ncbi:MAG: hypothetical protein F6K28_36945 [Microcoleus sp. SIO2G3]|nr:hypothetical protein [Microcoleus sp. SIO2G3]
MPRIKRIGEKKLHLPFSSQKQDYPNQDHQKLPRTHNFAEVNWKHKLAIPAILSFHRQQEFQPSRGGW